MSFGSSSTRRADCSLALAPGDCAGLRAPTAMSATSTVGKGLDTHTAISHYLLINCNLVVHPFGASSTHRPSLRQESQS